MKQIFKTKLKNVVIPLLLQCLFFVLLANQGFAQTNVFFEGMGTVTPTSTNNSIPNWESSGFFDETSLTMSGTATITDETPAQLTSPNNVKFVAGQNFIIRDINTTDFTSLSLSFDIKKNKTIETTSQNFTVAYSLDGTSFTNTSYLSLSTGAGSDVNWESRSVGVPDGIVALRFTNTTSSTDLISFNVDNIRLAGQTTVTNSPPSISDFSPKSGGLGTEIIITGLNLQNVKTAWIVLEDLSDYYQLSIPDQDRKEDSLKVIVVNGKTNSYFIRLESSYGAITSSSEFELKAPTITSMTPGSGPVGSTVTLTGTFLGTAYQANFGGGISTTAITVVDASDTNSEVTVVVPEGAQSSQITLLTSYGPATTPTVFTVLRPVISSLSTTSGMLGSTVQINGTRLNEGGEPAVAFNGVAAAVSEFTATAVTVIVPIGATSGPITLTTSEGTATYSDFTVLQPNIVTTGTLSPFSTEATIASAEQTYIVSGTNLLEKVLVSAPTNFQVSLTSIDGFGPSVEIPLSNEETGTLEQTPIYVRYFPQTAGSDSGNITHTSEAAPGVDVAVTGEATPIGQGTMPVEFVSFTYVQSHDGVLLKWRTATESNNSHFEVEMSYNAGNGFKQVAAVQSKVVNASAYTNYHYKHSYRSVGGTRYYRLKQVDLDGTFSYSNVVAVEAAPVAIGTVAVAPNPVVASSKVFISAIAGGKAQLRLHNLDGKQVAMRAVQLNLGENELQLPEYEKLAPGIYLLTVELNDTVQQVKLVKQ